MVDVFRTWESLYWMVPKERGVYVRTREDDYGGGEAVTSVAELFGQLDDGQAQLLYNRVKDEGASRVFSHSGPFGAPLPHLRPRQAHRPRVRLHRRLLPFPRQIKPIRLPSQDTHRPRRRQCSQVFLRGRQLMAANRSA